jgi:hypothetical protein
MPLRRTLALSTMIVAAAFGTARGVAAAEPSKSECIAANESAQELRRGGSLREARGRLRVCVAQACPGPVREDCAQRLSEIDSAMPTIVFEVKDGGGSDLSAVKITVDGSPLADRLDGAALAVDPGEHTFRFEAEGLPAVEKKFVIRETEKGRRERVVMGTSSSAASKPEPTSDAVPPRRGDADAGSTQRTIGLVTGGVGVVGLIVGSIFGLVSKSTYDGALKNNCNNNPASCNGDGVTAGKDAHTQAMTSTIGFIAGGVLLAGGALLYFTAPSGAVTVAPLVGRGNAGLSVRGAW